MLANADAHRAQRVMGFARVQLIHGVITSDDAYS